jgi:putative RNA 2'-phosphotransferase
VLRHTPEAAGVALDPAGWADLNQILAAAVRHGLAKAPEDVARVVASNDKKRFALSDDGTRIRAVQGHSTSSVSMDLQPVEPPEYLFHGTAEKNLAAIFCEGLKAGRRHHVHLSTDELTAERVGRRHGSPVVLRIASHSMWREGGEFYLAENGVWLADAVPAQYLEKV